VSVNRTRSALYSLARFLGDYQAVKRGPVGKRLYNKAIGRTLVPRLWQIEDVSHRGRAGPPPGSEHLRLLSWRDFAAASQS